MQQVKPWDWTRVMACRSAAAVFAVALAGVFLVNTAVARPIPVTEVKAYWTETNDPVIGKDEGNEWKDVSVAGGQELRSKDYGMLLSYLDADGDSVNDFVIPSGDWTFSGRFRPYTTDGDGQDDDCVGFVIGWKGTESHVRFGWDAMVVNNGIGDELGLNGEKNYTLKDDKGNDIGDAPKIHGVRVIWDDGTNYYLFQDPDDPNTPGADGARPWTENQYYTFSAGLTGTTLSIVVDEEGGANIMTLSTDLLTNPDGPTVLDLVGGQVGVYSSSTPYAYFSLLEFDPVADPPPSGAVPEPCGMGLIGLGLLAMRKRRRS